MTAAVDVASLRIGFIGAGQLAMPLAWSLARCRYRVVGAASRSRSSAEKLAAGIEGAHAYDEPQRLADASDLVFIAVPDDAIAAAARSVTWTARHAVVHCSGATEVAALAPAAAAGAAIGGFHPLQTFTDTEAAMRTLPGCTVAVEADEPLFGTLTAMASTLGCHPLRLPAGARALYHASGSFASSFLVGLMNDALTLWEAFGVNREDAFRALLPLTKGTVAALEANGPIRSLAGPIARGRRHGRAPHRGAAPTGPSAAADLRRDRAAESAHRRSKRRRQQGKAGRTSQSAGARGPIIRLSSSGSSR